MGLLEIVPGFGMFKRDKQSITAEILEIKPVKAQSYWEKLREQQSRIEARIVGNTDPKLKLVEDKPFAPRVSLAKKWESNRLEKRANSYRIIREK